MNIPELATPAAIYALAEFDEMQDFITEDLGRFATAALEAALPHLEAALRKQIAADIRDIPNRTRPLRKDAQTATDYANDLEWAALTAEEGPTK